MTALDSTAAATARGWAVADFFRHHGIWAPGVRAFRQMTFAGKSSLIALAFLVPVLLLAGLFVPETLRDIRRTRLEETSLKYVGEVVALLRRAQDYRGQALRTATRAPAGDFAHARAELDAQFERLGRIDAEVGARLGTSDALAQARAKLAAVADPSQGLLKVYASNAKLMESLYALVAGAADGGGLTLDPDLDASTLLGAGVTRMPRLVDEASRMSDLAAATAAAGDSAAIAGVEINRLDTVIEDKAHDVTLAMGKVVARHPEALAMLDVKPMMKAIDALRDESTDSPGTGGARRAARLQALGSTALDAAWASQGRMTAMLDTLLAAREQRTIRSLELVATAVAVSLLAASYMLYSFFLVVNGGLAEARRHLDRMAEGDLTSEPSPWGKDDAADLMHSLLRMQTAVRLIVAGVRGSAEAIAASSAQIAQGVADISSRTELTAASLQQSSSSMHQIAATASGTATVAQQAAGLATESARMAAEGGRIVENMTAKMGAIDGSSRQIADIIGVIDGIAFQTSILALNAAVEAARAGEQGRGFAVVASEVRMLAGRSSEAARAIKSLIGSSVENVEAGAAVVLTAGDAMTRIVDNADRACRLLAALAEDAQRQHQRVGDVSATVLQVDDSTQRNAVLAEEAAAATGHLNDQARDLLARVARFRLPIASLSPRP